MINFKKIRGSASCNVSDNVAFDNENIQSIEVICSIQGYDQCPMYDIPYIEVEDNNPATDESTINPKILQFSDFKNKNLNFSNYYISLVNLYNDNCNQDVYEFDLNINSISEDIPYDLSFSLNLTNTEGKEIEADCHLENNNNKELNLINIANENENKIHCEIKNDVLDDNYILNLNYIYLEQEQKYLINLGEKTLNFGYKDCPSFSFSGNSTIVPTNTSDKSFIFYITIISSYTDEIYILIYDKHLNPKEYIIFILKTENKDTNEEFIANCTLPEKTSQIMNISCFVDNIYDDKSDYFVFNSTEDIIRINNKNISLLNVLDDLKILNIFKDEGGGEEEEEEEEKEEEEEGKEEEEEEEGTHPDVDPSGKEKSFFSTVGGIILIVVISLLVIIIIIIIIYCICEAKNKKNKNGANIRNEDNKGDRGNNKDDEEDGENIIDNKGDGENNKNNNNIKRKDLEFLYSLKK